MRVVLALTLTLAAALPGFAAVQTKDVDLRVRRRDRSRARWPGTTPPPASGPGVLVVHEWWGLDDYAKGRAKQLAGMGYVAFACDMYGDGKHVDHPKDAGRDGRPRSARTSDVWRGRAKAALKVLADNEHVDAYEARRHRLLLRRLDVPAAGVQRGRPEGDRDVPRRPADAEARGGEGDQGRKC